MRRFVRGGEGLAGSRLRLLVVFRGGDFAVGPLRLRERVAVLVQQIVALHVLVPSVGPSGNREGEEANETDDDEYACNRNSN